MRNRISELEGSAVTTLASPSDSRSAMKADSRPIAVFELTLYSLSVNVRASSKKPPAGSSCFVTYPCQSIVNR